MSNEFLEALNRHTAREEERLDRIHERLAEISMTLERQAGILSEHIRRSEANEQAVEVLSKRLRLSEDASLTWAVFGKSAAIGVSLAGVVVAILKALGVA